MKRIAFAIVLLCFAANFAQAQSDVVHYYGYQLDTAVGRVLRTIDPLGGISLNSGTITWNNDVSLYRPSAGLLKTNASYLLISTDSAATMSWVRSTVGSASSYVKTGSSAYTSGFLVGGGTTGALMMLVNTSALGSAAGLLTMTYGGGDAIYGLNMGTGLGGRFYANNDTAISVQRGTGTSSSVIQAWWGGATMVAKLNYNGDLNLINGSLSTNGTISTNGTMQAGIMYASEFHLTNNIFALLSSASIIWNSDAAFSWQSAYHLRLTGALNITDSLTVNQSAGIHLSNGDAFYHQPGSFALLGIAAPGNFLINVQPGYSTYINGLTGSRVYLGQSGIAWVDSLGYYHGSGAYLTGIGANVVHFIADSLYITPTVNPLYSLNVFNGIGSTIFNVSPQNGYTFINALKIAPWQLSLGGAGDYFLMIDSATGLTKWRKYKTAVDSSFFANALPIDTTNWAAAADSMNTTYPVHDTLRMAFQPEKILGWSGTLDTLKMADTIALGGLPHAATVSRIIVHSSRSAYYKILIEQVDSLYQAGGGTMVDTPTVIWQKVTRGSAPTGGTFSLTQNKVLRFVMLSDATAPKQCRVEVYGRWK